MPAPELWKSSVLKALPVTRNPHFGPPLARGRHVGYRKLDAERGTWIARLRGSDGKMRFQSLGEATPTFQWHQAKTAAEEWFTTQGDGTPQAEGGAPLGRAYTVTDACRALVTARRAEYEADIQARGEVPFKTDKPAWKDAQYRFQAHIYDKPFGAEALATLTSNDIETWRESLEVSKATQNRVMTSFRAAFNLAVKKQRIPESRAIQMRKVTQHFIGEANRKTPYLDLEQRRDFLAACGGEGDFLDLVRACMLTGARPGEIVKLRRRQFEPRTKSVTFIGKTRRKTAPRTVPLSDEALALFARRALAAPKPDDLLFTNAGKLWEHDGDGWGDRVYGAAREARSPENTTLACFRHAWITDALESGMSPLQVSKLVGTSLAMIQQTYGHLLAKRSREQLNAVQFC